MSPTTQAESRFALGPGALPKAVARTEGGSIKMAVVMLALDLGAEAARQRLSAANGLLAAALGR